MNVPLTHTQLKAIVQILHNQNIAKRHARGDTLLEANRIAEDDFFSAWLELFENTSNEKLHQLSNEFDRNLQNAELARREQNELLDLIESIKNR